MVQDGKSPLDCAIKRKHHDIVKFLKYPLHDAVIDMNMKRVKYYVEVVKVDVALKDDVSTTIICWMSIMSNMCFIEWTNYSFCCKRRDIKIFSRY